jgi:hypothetical protein
MNTFFHAGNQAKLVLEKTLKELIHDGKANSHGAHKLMERYFTKEVESLKRKIFEQASANSKFLDGFGL